MLNSPPSGQSQSRRGYVAPRRQHLPNIGRYGTLAAALTALSACGTTGHFVAQPQLTIDGSQENAHQTVTRLLGSDTPYTIRFCEADPSSKQCESGSDSISATGVGGLLFPLVLNVHGMRVSQVRQSSDGLAIDAAFLSRADGIPPLCASAQGTVISRDNGTAVIHVGNFYCNWMLVGNVRVDAICRSTQST